MNMNEKHSYSLMRPAARLTYGGQSQSTLWLTRGKMFIIRQMGYDASKQFGEKILCEFQNKRKIFEGFHSFGRKKFLFDEIVNTNPVFPEIWGKIFFLKSGEKIFFPEKIFFLKSGEKIFFLKSGEKNFFQRACVSLIMYHKGA